MSAPEPPLAVLAEVTHRCPMQCPYCSNPLELERSSTELGVVPGFGQVTLRRIGEHKVEARTTELVDDPLQHQVDDLLDLVERQLVIDDDFVDPVDELGTEVPLELFGHLALHLLVVHLV